MEYFPKVQLLPEKNCILYENIGRDEVMEKNILKKKLKALLTQRETCFGKVFP